MEQRKFTVLTLGFDAKELRVLGSIGWLSTTRARCYVLVEGESMGTDICLVDGSNPEALEAWDRLRRTRPFPVIFVGGADPYDERARSLTKPIVAGRLLSLLDEITVQDKNFLPELTIGQEVVPEPATLHTTLKRDTLYAALVVDDSIAVHEQIEIDIRPFAFAVEFAQSGEEAMMMLNERSYDLVFLDVVLPGIDGYQLCRAIKRDKNLKRTPVIMLTDRTGTVDRVKGKFAGCDSYLVKPVENKVLQEVVARYVTAFGRQAALARTQTCGAT